MGRSVSDRVRRHREELRARGLRPIQIWVPDTRSEAFDRECERQSRLVAEAPEGETAELLDVATAEVEGWDP